jgi:hypothetical protein
MLQQEQLGAVDVVIPDTLHFEPCMEALQAGKHVLVEKRLRIELGETRPGGRGPATPPPPCAEPQEGFAAPYQTGERRLGGLWHMVPRRAEGGPYGEREPYDWVWDMACHLFDLLRFFAGEIECIQAEMTHLRETGYWTSLALSIADLSQSNESLLRRVAYSAR